jgi:hypothetical protein
MTINTTNNRGVQPVAETETLPPRLHFDDGCFQGTLKNVFRTRVVTKEHLINQLEELIRRNDESGIDDAGDIWEHRCLHELLWLVESVQEAAA